MNGVHEITSKENWPTMIVLILICLCQRAIVNALYHTFVICILYIKLKCSHNRTFWSYVIIKPAQLFCKSNTVDYGANIQGFQCFEVLDDKLEA